MKRRTFLKNMTYMSVLLSSPSFSSLIAKDNNYLNDDLGTKDITEPYFYNALSENDTSILLKYVEFIHNEWSIPIEINSVSSFFSSKVTPDTFSHPHSLHTPSSYYSEYRQAIIAYEILSDKYGENSTFAMLFHIDEEVKNLLQTGKDKDASKHEFWNSRLGHIRKYVIDELGYLIMRQGGFKKYGYKNYRGYKSVPLGHTDINSEAWPYTKYDGGHSKVEPDSKEKSFEIPLIGES